MIDSLRITRIFVALVVALLLPDVASGAEVCAVVSGDRGVYAHHESGGSATEYTFIGTSAPLLSTPAPTAQPSSFVPVVRVLPHATRTVERSFAYTGAVSAIDSTVAAMRYGLYNHKILFVSLARYYYLCRLVRLII